jgi:hypothetical protein
MVFLCFMVIANVEVEMNTRILSVALTLVLTLGVLFGASPLTARAASSGNIIDLSDAAPPASGNDWIYATDNNGDGVYTITGNNVNLTITGSSVVTTQNDPSKRVVVDGAKGAIAFDNLHIRVPRYTTPDGSRQQPPFELKNGANVEITLVGDNILESYSYGGGNNSAGAALAVPGGTTVTITSTTNGALTAMGGYVHAGIGGIANASFGAININGNAKITATGGEFGAGIGGGYGNTVGGTISIGGGANVTATGDHGGVGIGGGGNAYAGNVGGGGGTIIIGGGAYVMATGEGGGAGIGAGNGGNGTTDITIGDNATVTASGAGGGSGIGGGYVHSTFGGAQTITVTIADNAHVTATGGASGGAGIGTGYSDINSDAKAHTLTVTIGNSATVVATASGTAVLYNNSPGIGLAGENGSGGTAIIDILSPNVTATASTVAGKGYAPAIGSSDPGATITSLTYPVVISGGGSGATPSGSYSATAPLNINAGTKNGYTFDEWTTTSAHVVFDNAASATTFFSIPVDEVTISGPSTAIVNWYEDLSFTDSASYDIPASTAGTAIAAIDVSGGVSGGTAPYAFSADGLPAGISINAATGVISGTPTTAGAKGTATLTVTDSVAATESIKIKYGKISAADVQPVTYQVHTHFGTFAGSGANTARVLGEHSKFLRLEYGGSVVDPANYTTWSGSTYIQLKESHLKTYANGTHYFTAVYSDGRSENIRLDVNVTGGNTGNTGSSSPKTGDDMPLAILLLLCILTVSAMIGAVVFRRLRRTTY